jgi:hypothetical protein
MPRGRLFSLKYNRARFTHMSIALNLWIIVNWGVGDVK